MAPGARNFVATTAGIFVARAKAEERAPAMPGTDGEGLGLPFLPGQPFGLDDVERQVEDMEEAKSVSPVA
jgi:hypothetical protein